VSYIARLTTRGPAVGQCNICGARGPLTNDHTPPKSCGLGTPVELQSLRSKISTSGEKWDQPRRFQSGVTYRSLCARCNNKLLGQTYDPALASFSAQVRALASSQLALPSTVQLSVQPQAVIRSVIGHLCAQGVERYAKGPFTEPIRDYLLDSALPLPGGLRLYYWLYPYRSQVLIRDAARIEHLGSGQGVNAFWLMKFYPLAFMVTLDEKGPHAYTLTNLDQYGRDPFALVRALPLSLRPQMPGGWPEHPESDAAILYGPQAVVGDPAPPRRRRR
jgi:hypothetical protein